MQTIEPKAKYAFRYGGIEEVLEGEGKPVESFEDLYCSSRSKLIIVPRIIGVHQHLKIEECGECEGLECVEKGIDATTQRILKHQKGMHDETAGTLISLVYDPEVFTGDVLRCLISGKDTLKRLMLTGYDAAPDFSTKPVVSGTRVQNLFEELEGEKTRKHAIELLERESEYFFLNSKNYGLTRLEAINYETLRDIVEKSKKPEKKEGEGKNADLITDASVIRALSMLKTLLKDFLSGDGRHF